jgi:hypothetical protein
MKKKDREQKRMMRSAARATNTVRSIAASKWSKRDQRHYERRKMGTFGAASECRLIMKNGEFVE